MIAGAYLLGAVPFGLLIGLMRGVDIRKAGSMNIGATNCGRVCGRKWGLLCFVLDLLKGSLPVVGAGWWFGLFSWQPAEPRVSALWLGTGMAAVLGHVFPVYLGFKGGKGVATTFGIILGYWPFLTLPALGAVYTWLLYAASMRYVSLASMVVAVALPFYLWLAAEIFDWPPERMAPFYGLTILIGLLILIRHRANLSRLAAGTESRLGARRKG